MTINRTLAEWLDYISSTHPSEIEMGLERIKSVYQTLSIPRKLPKIVLVAGTNGKGSTVSMMEAGFLKLGCRVGTYTSPHILAYNERVRINGANVSDHDLVDAFQIIEQKRKNTPLTYFEFGTLAAFQILLNQRLDVVLLEVGLGGRLDAVNIVEPDISIITSIGIDHADWLGDSIEKIGVEKAGILRTNSIFIGGENLPESINHVADELSCQSLVCRKQFDSVTIGDDKAARLFFSESEAVFSGFPRVLLPENNILISLQAIALLYQQLLGEKSVFDQRAYETVVNAINGLSLPGRLEKLTYKDLQDFYIDVGHNPHAALYLKSFLMHHAHSEKKIQIVYSSLTDKDVLEIFRILAPLVDRCVLVPLHVDRAMPLTQLLGNTTKANIKNVVSFESVEQGIENAISYSLVSAEKQQPVLTLIFGSFYMVEAAKRFFENYE